MDVSNIQRFLSEIGCRKIAPASRVVRASCPFEHLHSEGVDSHPSFAVTIKEGDESGWKCFGCKRSGAMERLVQYLSEERRFPKTKIDELYKFVWKNDRVSLSRLRERTDGATWRSHDPKAFEGVFAPIGEVKPAPPPELPTIPEEFLSDYFVEPMGEGLKYLVKERGFTEETIAAWELRWHPTQKRIAIPARRLDGKLVGISGRAIGKKHKPKYLHAKGFKGEHYLFGEDKVEPGGTGIVVEGQFDVIAMWQYGYRDTVAIFGSYLNKPQAEKCVLLFTDVIVLADADKAGKEATKQIVESLGARMPVRVVELPAGMDPGSFTEKRLTKEEVIQILGFPPTR